MSDENEKKSALAPRLRFPEFRGAGEWEVKTLGDCLDYQQPTDYLVSDTNYNDDYETPVLTAGKTFVLGYTNEKHGIFSEGLPVIIFDDFTTATQFVDFPFKAKSSAMKVLQEKNGANIKFMYEVMQMISYQVGVHERHWISRFSPIQILVPCPKEQQKIADCLSSLDELIAAETQKLDALVTHKKGLMQQLFPAEGETVPRLRFPEFREAGKWKEWLFGDLLDGVIDFRGRTPAKLGMEWGGGDIPALSANNVKNGFIDYNAECYLGSEELHFRWMGEVDLEKEDIVFTMEAPLGNALLLPDSRKYILSQRVVAFKTKANVLNPFLVQLIWGDCFQNDIVKLATGSTAKGINQKSLRTILVRLPDTDEQQQIADCLTALDDLIAAQAQKIELLKRHKKGLMQQLFPVLNDDCMAAGDRAAQDAQAEAPV